MGQHESCWQNNTNFSSPPSRWDFSFPSEELPYESPEATPLFRSSTSSNQKEYRWMRGNNHCSASGSAGLLLSSPDLSSGPQWMPPVMQEISANVYETATRRGQVLQPLPSAPSIVGTSGNPESRGSTSSFSDSSESDPTFKSCPSNHCNSSSRRSFFSKPIHPLFFPTQATSEASTTPATGSLRFDAATLRRDSRRLTSASSSIDFSDISEQFESENLDRLFESENLDRLCISSDSFKCGLCERFLSQRSPWSSRQIVSGDMPVAGVLSCCHVFHADCLEQTTPTAHKNDPPCPLCVRSDEEKFPELQVFPRLKNRFSSITPSSEFGPSRPWGFVTKGDSVEGALHAPHQNTMLLLNRNRMRKNLFLKGNSGKEFPGKLMKSGSYSSQLLNGKSVDFGTVGCSNATANPSVKR